MESIHSPVSQFRIRKLRPCGKKESNIIALSEEKSITVGRVLLDDVHTRLHSKSTPLMISRKHATLTVVENQVFVVDHNSTNGVYINNKRIEASSPQEIKLGDWVAFGCGVGSGPPEFEYILENSAPVVCKSKERKCVPSPAKRQRINEESISVTIIESNTVQIKEQEKKISLLAKNLEEKEATYNKLLNQLQETESDMLKRLDEQRCQLEVEHQHAETRLKCLLGEQLMEKEFLLKSEYDIQLKNLQEEKELVEKHLQGELSKKLSEKDEVYQKELEDQKLQLEKTMIDKESEKQKLVAELNVKESLLEKYKSVEENQKHLETCLQELRKEILEKDNQLEKQKEFTQKVELSAKQHVIQTMEDEFTCIICSELFIEATTLPCAHTFCEMCLRHWLKKKKNCPVCRRRIKGKAVKSLVLDSVVEKMLETVDDTERKRRIDLQKEREAQKKSDDSTEASEDLRVYIHDVDDDGIEELVATRGNERSNTVRDPRNRRENNRRRSRSRSPRNQRHRLYHDNRYGNNNHNNYNFQNNIGYLNQLNYNYNNNNNGNGRHYQHDRSASNSNRYFTHGFQNGGGSNPNGISTHYHNNTMRCFHCGGLDHVARYCPGRTTQRYF